MEGSGVNDNENLPRCEEPGPRRAVDAFVVRLVWAPGKIAVVAVAGEVDYHTSTCLRDLVELALDAGAAAMIVDLSEVTFLDASGLGVAVLAARALGAARTVIVCPDPRLVRVFRVTALDRVLTISDDRETALAGLAPEPVRPSVIPLADTDLPALPEAG